MRRKRGLKTWCCAAGFLAALGIAPALGQGIGFGQNKVQYHSFKWSYYQTEHFDIYFPQGASLIAQFAARHVEEMYQKVSALVGHRLNERVPIILHNSHAEFEQTNVIPIPLDEAIGGFTEEFKNRIVLPFEGSYAEFYHVLRHEMTHAIVFNMLFGEGAGQAMARQAGGQFPLWINEGLAEYASLGWDLGSEFFMVDATTFGYVAPPTMDFYGFLAYKGGQLFLYFLDSVYGKGTVSRFIKALTETRDIPSAFQKVTHTSLEEAGEIWLRELRYLYWPELGQRQYGKSVARKLTNHGKDHSFYNLQPSLSPNGEEIAIFSDRQSWEAIYILNVKTEKVSRTVIQGGKSGGHESFHSFKSGIAWSPDGKSLAIVSKQGGKDVIHVIDAKKGKVRRVLKPGVQAVLSPSWSRDGRMLAFSGQNEGLVDLYVCDLTAGTFRRLTSDIAHDDKPVFSPSGKWIAFESDRPGPMRDPNPKDPLAWYDSLLPFKDIYRISVSGDSLTRLAGGAWDEKMPAYGPSDSQLVFVSNRSGLDNLYLWRDSAGTPGVRPLSNLLTGCFTPSLSYDGKQLAFSLFEEGGWDIYLMKDPLTKTKDADLPKTRFIRSREDSTAGFFRPLNWATLSSYKPDTAAKDSAKKDSLKKAAAKDSVNKDVAGKPPADSLKAAAPAKDSARAGADSARSAAGKDSSAGKTDTMKVAQAEKPKPEGKRGRKPSPFLQDTARYKGADGSFIARDYSPKWSLDAFNAALGVDNYYGAGGLAFITLSDLMGDQSLSFALSMNGSFENTNGFAEYSYLPYKPDFTALVFHQAQQTSTVEAGSGGIFERNATDRQYGFGVGVRYPLSTFTRVEAELLTRFNKWSEERIDTNGVIDSSSPPPVEINAFMPTVAWVHDNSQWGIVGPVAGKRLLAVAQYLPPLLQDTNSYVKAEADFRSYWEFFKRYTLALRVTAGASEAVGGRHNPHRFVLGGESFTFNPHWNIENIGKTTLAEYYFSDLDFPLRGYDFYDFVGSRKFLTNLEFRFPFLREFTVVWPLPFSIRNVMGNVFMDWGGAWSQGDAFDQFGMGLGYGLRLNLGIFVLKYTYAESVQGMGGYQKGSREYWSLGTEF